MGVAIFYVIKPDLFQFEKKNTKTFKIKFVAIPVLYSIRVQLTPLKRNRATDKYSV